MRDYRNGQRRTRLRLLAIIAAVAAPVLLPGVPASADRAPRAIDAKLTIEQTGSHSLAFVGPRTIPAGGQLRITNKTRAADVGPHTFSVVRKGDLPTEKSDFRQCFKLRGICGAVAATHELDADNQVQNRDVEAGERGWDTAVTLEAPGDSWYTDGKNERTSRGVVLPAGETLFYFCAVHPEMQGRIRTE